MFQVSHDINANHISNNLLPEVTYESSIKYVYLFSTYIIFLYLVVPLCVIWHFISKFVTFTIHFVWYTHFISDLYVQLIFLNCRLEIWFIDLVNNHVVWSTTPKIQWFSCCYIKQI